MPRRRVAAKREILPDPLFGSVEIAKFINSVMCHGKKSVAEKLVYKALERVARPKSDQEHLAQSESSEGSAHWREKAVTLFTEALEKVSPLVEVRARRVGGATYQIPVEVRATRRGALARRWIIEAAQQRSEKTMADRLALELKDILENKGGAMKKRDEMHRMAKANQAFAHLLRVSN